MTHHESYSWFCWKCNTMTIRHHRDDGKCSDCGSEPTPFVTAADQGDPATGRLPENIELIPPKGHQ